MNLVLNVNTNLYSVQRSVDGDKKVHGAIDEAMNDIKHQLQVNTERQKKGFKPLPYQSIVKDEYGKELVSIKETKSLEEIRKEYLKIQENLPFEKREENLLKAMDEVGNSSKNEFAFKEDLAKQLNSALFVMDAELTPGLEKILDFFGDSKGMFNSINFKDEIAQKCIKELIDLPNPNTGKPPKTFEQLFSNIISVNEVFKENPNRERYIELARSYINISYKFLIPKNYKSLFAERGGLDNLLRTKQKQITQKETLNKADFEVSEKNFKKMYQVFSNFEQFKNKPLTVANYLMNRVPENKKENFRKWFVTQGCKDEVSTIGVLTKWSNEIEREQQKNKTNEKSKSGRGY